MSEYKTIRLKFASAYEQESGEVITNQPPNYELLRIIEVPGSFSDYFAVFKAHTTLLEGDNDG